MYWEAHLSQGHWANIAEDLRLWYMDSYSQECRERREQINEEVLPIIERAASERLTVRQEQVFMAYFFQQRTQVQIAGVLGISQPTVNQHLRGKVRSDKRVGGAIRRLRKSMRKEAEEEASAQPETDGTRIFTIILGLLDDNVTRRKVAHLIRTAM